MEYGIWEMFWIGWIAGCMVMGLGISITLGCMLNNKKRK